MGRNLMETLMGAFVLLVAGVFVVIAYRGGNISTPDGYVISARFNEVGALSLGSDVRVGGIKIGTIASQRLDPETFQAVVDLNIRKDIKLPVDSVAAVVSDGLLGGKYITISPGAEEENVSNGGNLRYTQDAVNLETLLGKFAFGSAEKSN